MERAAGVRAIVTYKLVKAGVQLVLAALLVALGTGSIGPKLEAFAHGLRNHATEGWSVAIWARLMPLLTHRALTWTAVALAADAVVCAIEGGLLARGVRWAPFLVVGASGCLLPWEVYALARDPHVGRLVLFLVNAAIVAYLLHHLLRRRPGHLVAAR